MPEFNWDAARQAVRNSADNITRLKQQVYKLQFGFWEKQAGCQDQRKNLIQKLNQLENLVQTISMYVKFNCLHFKQNLQQHIYLKKVNFFDNLFKTIQNILCYLFPIFGLAYYSAISLGFLNSMSTTAKIVTGTATCGFILIGTLVKTIYDAQQNKQKLEKATEKTQNAICSIRNQIKEEEETEDSD